MAERISNPEDVAWCYRLLLGREPESVGGMLLRALRYPDLRNLVASIASSGEARARFGGALGDIEGTGVIDEFEVPGLVGSPGVVTDFQGGRTRIDFLAEADAWAGRVESPPCLGNIWGGAAEWVGLLAAVKATVHTAVRSFNIIEIGAAWGPWSVAAAIAARRCGCDQIRIMGVEPAPNLCLNMARHFEDNGFGPDRAKVVQAAAGVRTGAGKFAAVSDPRRDFHNQVEILEAPAPASDGFMNVEVKSMPHLFEQARDHGGDIDLLVLTVGGAEADLLNDVDVQGAPFRSILVTTSGLEEHSRIWSKFLNAGWRSLVNAPPAVGQDSHNRLVSRCLREGVQAWVR